MAAAHPLDDDATAIRAAGGWLNVFGPGEVEVLTTGSAPAWHRADDLIADLSGWQRTIEADLRRRYPGSPPHPSVAPTYLMGFYLDAVARTGALWLGLRARVPELSVAGLWLELAPGGWPNSTGVAAHPFACLPDDPAATHPQARVVADRPTLLGEYRRAVARCVEPFQAAFAPGVKIGSRQRRGMLADVVETAVWQAGDLRGTPSARLVAAEEAEALVGPNPSRRRSCCFAYRLEPALLCTRCPRRARPMVSATAAAARQSAPANSQANR